MISPAIAPNMHFEGGGEKAERPAADVIAVVADDIFRYGLICDMAEPPQNKQRGELFVAETARRSDMTGTKLTRILTRPIFPPNFEQLGLHMFSRCCETCVCSLR